MKRLFISGWILGLAFYVFAQQDEHQMTLELYVQLMTDCGYNFDQINPGYYDVVRPSQLPSFQEEYGTDGNIWFSVRQSYLGLKGYFPTRLGELRTIFEFDLFGLGPNVGQTAFHLSKAYAELGHFGFGRFWSPFVDRDIYPNSIEYWGPNGMALCPNIQLRWMPIMGDNRLIFALERPGASVDEGKYHDRIEIEDIKLRFPAPDFSAEYRHGTKFGYVELAGLVRYIEWIDLNPDSPDFSGQEIGWGLNLSSKVRVSNRITGKFQVVYGKAIENYMNDGPIDIAIEQDLSDLSKPAYGKGLPVLGVSSFLDIQWNDRFSSSIGYSLSGISNSNGQDSSAFKQGQYALANLLYYPVQNAMLGVELQYGSRANFSDGWRTDIVKIQFSFRFNFSHSFFQADSRKQN